jgi:hypothetical protein
MIRVVLIEKGIEQLNRCRAGGYGANNDILRALACNGGGFLLGLTKPTRQLVYRGPLAVHERADAIDSGRAIDDGNRR